MRAAPGREGGEGDAGGEGLHAQAEGPEETSSAARRRWAASGALRRFEESAEQAGRGAGVSSSEEDRDKEMPDAMGVLGDAGGAGVCLTAEGDVNSPPKGVWRREGGSCGSAVLRNTGIDTSRWSALRELVPSIPSHRWRAR